MSNILVTGAAGFLGSHMVDFLLEKGESVFGLDNFQSGARSNVQKKSHFIEGDIRSRDWWKLLPQDISHIYHFAANASVPVSTEDPVYDTSTNVVGLTQILELAREKKSHFNFISSAAVYGTPEQLPTPESHPLKPISIYGISKLAGEQLVQFYQKNHGLSAQIIRYFNCFGPRQPRYILFDYLKKAESRQGPFLVLGDGKQRRTQLFATDAVAATHLIAQKGDHQPYNVGSEKIYTVLEIAHHILSVTQQKDRKIECTGVSWPGDISVLQPNLQRLTALGFSPKIDLPTGIDILHKWWVQR